MAYISDVSGIEVQKLLQVFGLFLFSAAGKRVSLLAKRPFLMAEGMYDWKTE